MRPPSPENPASQDSETPLSHNVGRGVGAEGDEGGSFLDLYDFRRQVFGSYTERNRALADGQDAGTVLGRFRTTRDRLFASHPQSALDAGQRRRFQGLNYFPYLPAASVHATVDTDVDPEPLQVVVDADVTLPMQRAARLRFTFDDRSATLTLFWIDVYGGGLFLPFRDTTAPKETYGGGRYLIDTVKGSDFIPVSDRGGEHRLLLDFNYAYNPSCAYNYRWACPLAPPENHLAFSVRAGERVFSHEHVADI